MHKLRWKNVIAWQLQRQHLDKRVPRTKLLQLTSELCGLHAQVMSSAELTALCRIEGLRPDDVSRALWTDRSLIRTWAMRATLHLIPASEYGNWLRVFSHLRAPWTARWLTYFGLSDEELENVTEACGVATRGRMLTREQLADEIVRLTGIRNAHDKLRLGWGTLLKPACYRGYLCFGPNQGQNTQFTHPEIAPALTHTDDFVSRRYFSTYGPATEAEFARWLQGGRKNVRAHMRALGDELIPVDVEGVSAWMVEKDYRAASKSEPVKTVRLLPAFDQYVFAGGLRSRQLLPGDFHSRVYKTQGWFAPVLLVDGRMDGVWSFSRKGKALHVTVEPFVKATLRVRQAAEEEAERLAQYMGRPLELKWLA